MTTPSQPTEPLSPGELQRELDRLVDGELSPVRQRELLLRLEQLEQGWKRCALAFLEAQAWQHELQNFSGDEPEAPDQPAASRASATDSAEARPSEATANRRPGWLLTVLSMAACFAIAFGLGWGVQRGQHPDPAQFAGPNATSPQTGDPVVASVPSRGAADRRPLHEVQLVGPAEAAVPRWGHVRLLVNRDGTWQPLDLPAVDGVDADRWLAAQPSAVPSDWREDLQRQGHTVQTQRELVPVDLGDGRQLVVPVENVEVQYVGGHRYQ